MNDYAPYIPQSLLTALQVGTRVIARSSPECTLGCPEHKTLWCQQSEPRPGLLVDISVETMTFCPVGEHMIEGEDVCQGHHYWVQFDDDRDGPDVAFAAVELTPIEAPHES